MIGVRAKQTKLGASNYIWSISIRKSGRFTLSSKQISPLLPFSPSVMSDSLQTHAPQPTRLLCPWDFPGKNAEVGCNFLLHRIFPTQGSNPWRLLHWQVDSLTLSHRGSPTQLKKNQTVMAENCIDIINITEHFLSFSIFFTSCKELLNLGERINMHKCKNIL